MNKKILKYGAIAILLAGFLLAAGCTGTDAQGAAAGDTISLNYTLYLKNESGYELFQENVPLEFELGSEQLLPAFEEQVTGMKVGESKTFEIPADQAYGEYYPDLVVNLTTDQFEEGEVPEPGAMIPLMYEGQFVYGTVLGVSEENVTVDANHPLAGKDLKFDIIILDIVKEK
jgi:peptidylprolyl isomerase